MKEYALSEGPFLVEECAWYNLNNSIFSNHLLRHVVLAEILLVIEVFVTTPLSLFVTIPTLYFVIQVHVSNSENWILYTCSWKN